MRWVVFLLSALGFALLLVVLVVLVVLVMVGKTRGRVSWPLLGENRRQVAGDAK